MSTEQVLNPLDAVCNVKRPDAVCVSNLKNARKVDEGVLAERPDVKIFLPFRFYFYRVEELFAPQTYNRFLGECPAHSKVSNESPFNILPSFIFHSRTGRRPSNLIDRRNIICLPTSPNDIADRWHPARAVLQWRQSSGRLRSQLHVHAQGGHPAECRCRGCSRRWRWVPPHITIWIQITFRALFQSNRRIWAILSICMAMRSMSLAWDVRRTRMWRRSIWSMPSTWIAVAYSIVNSVVRQPRTPSLFPTMAMLCWDSEQIIQVGTFQSNPSYELTLLIPLSLQDIGYSIVISCSTSSSEWTWCCMSERTPICRPFHQASPHAVIIYRPSTILELSISSDDSFIQRTI